MQAPASFNLEAVKEKIQATLKNREGRQPLCRRAIWRGPVRRLEERKWPTVVNAAQAAGPAPQKIPAFLSRRKD
jgi:hypothetical protein